MKMTLNFLFGLLIVSTLAYADGDKGAGNGGDGWIDPSDGKVYLYDLVEGGLHKNPSIDLQIEPSEDLRQELDLNLSFLNDDPSKDDVIRNLAIKITEIKTYSNSLASLITNGTKLFLWYKSNDLSLLDIKDEDAVHKVELVQLAGRVKNTIYVDYNLWEKMDTLNKTALIIHEMVYAIITPKTRSIEINGKIVKEKYQSSYDARSFVKYIFSSMLKARGLEFFKKITEESGLPLYQGFNALSFDLNGSAYSVEYIMDLELNGSELIYINQDGSTYSQNKTYARKSLLSNSGTFKKSDLLQICDHATAPSYVTVRFYNCTSCKAKDIIDRTVTRDEAFTHNSVSGLLKKITKGHKITLKKYGDQSYQLIMSYTGSSVAETDIYAGFKQLTTESCSGAMTKSFAKYIK